MKVIGVLGKAYNGSTLLNFLLGSYPRAYGGSELYRLRDDEKRATCSVCAADCVYWTPDNVSHMSAIGAGSFYPEIGELFGVDVICDSSKKPHHFLEMMSLDSSTEFQLLILAKHPLRHSVSAFMNNIVIPEVGRRPDEPMENLVKARRTEDVVNYIHYHLEVLSRFYKDLDRVMADCRPAGGIRGIKYEEICTNTIEELESTAEFAGLDPEALGYVENDQHPIGGNRTLSLLARVGQGRASDRVLQDDFKVSYFSRSDRIKVDNKASVLLNERTLKQLLADPVMTGLCERLGYSTDASQFYD